MSRIDVMAFRLLSQREHSAGELKTKLMRKGFIAEDVMRVIIKCQELDLQSDQRFAESLCRARIRQGYGPKRIVQDLKKAEIDPELIQKVILLDTDTWISHAKAAWLKKYKIISDLYQRQKCIKFLIYRGFSIDIIQKSLEINF